LVKTFNFILIRHQKVNRILLFNFIVYNPYTNIISKPSGELLLAMFILMVTLVTIPSQIFILLEYLCII